MACKAENIDFLVFYRKHLQPLLLLIEWDCGIYLVLKVLSDFLKVTHSYNSPFLVAMYPLAEMLWS